MKKQRFGPFVLMFAQILAQGVFMPALAHADDSSSASGAAATSAASQTNLSDVTKSSDTKEKVADGSAQKSSSENKSQENNRMKTLEGSRSRWSGQLNFTYSGGPLSNPVSSEAPNPSHVVPTPMVSLSGTVATRYRIDGATTMGVGAGLTTYTPFQGPKNTSIADPYVDIARSFKLGVINNRADFQTTMWTDNQYYSQDGYRAGFTMLDESYYTFPFGLLVGLSLQLDYNVFASGAYDLSQQMLYDLYTSPYFEFQVSKRINLRSVFGISPLQRTRDLTGMFGSLPTLYYQSLGVGVAVADSVFLYPYLEYYPTKPIMAQNTQVGLNAIINLF